MIGYKNEIAELMMDQIIIIRTIVLLISGFLTAEASAGSGQIYDVTHVKYDVSVLPTSKTKVHSIIHCAVYHALHSEGESLEEAFLYYPEDKLCWILHAEIQSDVAVDVTYVKQVRLGKRKVIIRECLHTAFHYNRPIALI